MNHMKVTVFYILCYSLYSCNQSCESYIDNYSSISCNLLIKENPNKGIIKGNFVLRGKDIETGYLSSFSQMSRVLRQHSGYFSVGDTFVKKVGLNYYVICKKHYRFYKLWYCKNNEFQENYFIDSFYQFQLNEIPSIDSANSVNIDLPNPPSPKYFILPKDYKVKLDSLKEI